MRKDTYRNLNTLKKQLHQKWYTEDWDTKENLTNRTTDFTHYLVWIILMIMLVYRLEGL